MKTTRLFLTALTAVCFTLPANAASKVEEWLNLMPKDTAVVIAIKDAPELLSDWDKSSYAKFMQDEETQRWLTPMKEDGEMPWDKYFKEIYGTGLYDTLKEERGAAVAFVVMPDAKSLEGKAGPPFVGLSEVGDNQAKLEEQRKKDIEHEKKEHPKLVERIEDIAGAQVHVAAETDAADAAWLDAYCIIEGVMIEAPNRKLMEYMIGALKSGTGEATPEAREHFARLSQLQEGRADLTLYINGGQFMKLVKEALATKKKESKAAPNPMEPDPEKMLEAFGLNELQGLAVTFDLADNRSRADMTILHPAKPAGFLSWIRTNATDVAMPEFIAADVMGGAVSRMSLVTIYDGIMGMLMKMSPQMGMMATMYLGGMEQQAGFKLRDDFFASLDDENFQVQDIADKKQSDVMGFKIKSAEKLGTALTGIKNMMGSAGFGAFDESEYLGYKLNSLKMTAAGAAAPEIAYCNTGKYLLIGTGTLDAMKKVLGRMKDPSGPSIWQSPRTQSQLALLPKGFSGIGVSDTSRMMSMGFNALETLSKQQAATKKASTKKKGPGKKGPAKGDGDDTPADSSDDKLAQFADPKTRPSDATFGKYFGTMMSATYSHPEAIQMHFLSTPVEAK